MEKARIEVESTSLLIHWYEVFEGFFRTHNIQAHKLYNWDEIGFQLGVGQKERVVSSRKKETIATGGIGQNSTGIECVSADGWYMHPWFLIRGVEQWKTGATAIIILPTTESLSRLDRW